MKDHSGRPFVKRFTLCYQTVFCLSVCLSVCLSCLSCLYVTLVYCGQTVGRIKMKLCMQVGLGPGHIVLDGTKLPSPKRGGAPNFRPISVVAKWLHGSRCQLVRRYRPRGPGDFVLDGDPAPLPQKGGGASPNFGPCLLWPNGWMDQDGTWHGGKPQPRRLCVTWGPSPLPNFRPISIVAK